MLKLNRSVLALGFIAALLAGCGAGSDIRDLYGRQARIEAKTELLSQDVETLDKRTQDLDSAEFDNERIARLEGQIKDLERAYTDLSDRLSELERSGLSSELPPASVSEPSQIEATFPGSDLYREAYANLSRGSYDEARQQFKSFIGSDPGSAEAANAQYWIAESYYREGKFEEAILEFQRFIDSYSKDEKVPLAFLKQGLSLINIDRIEEAKLFLQTLIDKFPRSEEAGIAREKLAELESGG